jgi:DNA excision repair protein ERCC-2
LKLDYGNLLIDLSTVVPDGIICFFPSYRYMEEVILNWNEMGIFDKILEFKLIYIETKDT